MMYISDVVIYALFLANLFAFISASDTPDLSFLEQAGKNITVSNQTETKPSTPENPTSSNNVIETEPSTPENPTSSNNVIETKPSTPENPTSSNNVIETEPSTPENPNSPNNVNDTKLSVPQNSSFYNVTYTTVSATENFNHVDVTSTKMTAPENHMNSSFNSIDLSDTKMSALKKYRSVKLYKLNQKLPPDSKQAQFFTLKSLNKTNMKLRLLQNQSPGSPTNTSKLDSKFAKFDSTKFSKLEPGDIYRSDIKVVLIDPSDFSPSDPDLTQFPTVGSFNLSTSQIQKLFPKIPSDVSLSEFRIAKLKLNGTSASDVPPINPHETTSKLDDIDQFYNDQPDLDLNLTDEDLTKLETLFPNIPHQLVPMFAKLHPALAKLNSSDIPKIGDLIPKIATLSPLKILKDYYNIESPRMGLEGGFIRGTATFIKEFFLTMYDDFVDFLSVIKYSLLVVYYGCRQYV